MPPRRHKEKDETVQKAKHKLKLSAVWGLASHTNDKNAAEQQKLEPASRTLFYYIVIVVWIQSSELECTARAALQRTTAMPGRRITCISCYMECIVTSWQENFKSANEHKAPTKSSSHQNRTEKKQQQQRQLQQWHYNMRFSLVSGLSRKENEDGNVREEKK